MAQVFKPYPGGLSPIGPQGPGASRPVLDRTHPLAKDLGFAIVLNDKIVTDLAGPSFDTSVAAVTGLIEHPPTVIAAGNNYIAPTPYGLGMQMGVVGSGTRTNALDFGVYQPLCIPNYPTSQDMTVLAIANPVGSGSYQQTFFSQRTQGGRQIDLIMNCNQTTGISSGQFCFFTNGNSVTTVSGPFDGVAVDGKFHAFVGRFSGANVDVFWDGAVATGNIGGSSTQAVDNTQKLCVGGLADYAGNEYAADCTIVCVYAWNRALTNDEIRQVSLNPYCFLTSAEPDMPAIVSGGGPVVFDAKATANTDALTAVTTISASNMTVGSGANRALILVVNWLNIGSSPASPVAHWDTAGTNQLMTLIGQVNHGFSSSTAIFGLVAPTSGNKNLTLTWTNAADCQIDLISFTGVDQTGGATSFPHFNSAVGTTSPASIAITSATGNYTVASFSADASADLTTLNQTVMYAPDLTDGNGSTAANYAAGSASNTHTCTLSATGNWAVAGCDIKAAGGGGSLVALLARSIIAAGAKLSFAGRTSVSGASKATVSSKAGFAPKATLTAKTNSATRSSGMFGMKTALAASASIKAFGKSTATGATSLAGRTISAFRAVGVTGAGAVVALLARMFISSEGSGSAAGKTPLAAKTSVAAQAKSNAIFRANIAGATFSSVKASLTQATGKVALAARATSAIFARISQPGALQLLAAAFIKTFGRLSSPTGKTSLQGQMTLTSSAASNPTFTQRMLASTRVAFASSGKIIGGVSLAGTSAIKTSGRAVYSRLVALGATAVLALRAVATSNGKVPLAGSTRVASKLRGDSSGVLPMIALLGATLTRVTISGLLYAFGISSRVLATPADLRTASAPADLRTVSAPSETRTVIAPPKN